MDHSPGFLKLVNEVRNRVKEVSVHDAFIEAKRPGVYLVDVREESEWQAGHAPTAIHLGKGIIERDVETRIPDMSARILCYCGGGYRSALAVDNLQKMGYHNVLSVAGGFTGWRELGLPVSTAPEISPRSPHEKLGGLYHLPRLVDKARLFPAGKLPGYNYLTTGFDKTLLDFLCLEGGAFEQIVAKNPTDEGVLSALKEKLGPAWPSDHAITDFNHKFANRRPDTPEKLAAFEQRRAACAPAKKKVETYFDLIDLEEDRLA
jgi:rhodanese-related sulfurtransferase